MSYCSILYHLELLATPNSFYGRVAATDLLPSYGQIWHFRRKSKGV